MENSNFEELSQNEIIAKQIEKLQQRQLEMVEQTTLELENLKSQLQNNQEVVQLKQYVANLEFENQKLSSNLEMNESQYLNQIRHIQESLSTILDQGFQATTPPMPVASNPVPFKPEAFVAPQPVKEVKPVKVKKERKVRNLSDNKPNRKLGISFAVLTVLGITSWQTVSPIITRNHAEALNSQVAGISTVKSVTTNAGASAGQTDSGTNNDYKQSKAIVSFAETKWETLTDKDFGIVISYPNNATNLVRTIGGNNIWFLRGEGYLMKVSRFDAAEKTIEAWWSDQQNSYTADYKIEKTTFKGIVAYHATPKTPDTFSGESYFLKKNNNIIQVWTKSQPDGQDDSQRLNQMVESLRIN